MAAIQPNSRVILFSGLPLDNTYSDTIYFGNLQAQTLWFTSQANPYREREFTLQTYQRINEGVFKAGVAADQIYDCNYMAFQNTNYGNKWFYAFINSIEFINNENSAISFEIDVMQTYFFDATLEESFIERQHSLTDGIGDNILPEPVTTGEYVFDDYHMLDNQFNSFVAIIAISTAQGGSLVDPTSVDGKVYDSVYEAALLQAVDITVSSGVQTLNDQIAQYISKPDEIVSIYMCPKAFLPTHSGGYEVLTTIPESQSNKRIPAAMTGIANYTTFGSYTPRNKKLFTYPFTFAHVDNGSGASLALRYEFFQLGTPSFMIDCCLTSPVQMKLSPTNYKLSGTEQWAENRSEFLTITGYPLCSWNYDTYRAWQAQNSIPNQVTGVLSAGAIVAGLAMGNAGIAMGGIAGITSLMKQDYTASIQADTTKGNVQSGNVDFSSKRMTFYAGRARITEDYARQIDSFFDMFGYAYNKHGIPNRSSRPHWNYVKTNGCKINGAMPTNAIRKMCEIYDAGVTFWKQAAEVGNYSLNNAPVTT